ncbi:MAG: ArsC family reductase [Granulosicoccus sp.]|nr:ArsC family reductase [Granulosicoccus sp.]
MKPHTVRVYGIANCDTVRKARRWLDAQSIEHAFHDYKKQGIDKPTLTRWCEVLGWESLLNRRGTTWRKLADADKQALTQARAIELMLDNTSLIKRPVIDTGQQLIAGFDEEQYQQHLN